MLEILIMPYANNRDADQAAHTLSLISTFVVRFLGSMMPAVAVSEVPKFLLTYVAEQANLTLISQPQGWFSYNRAQMDEKQHG